MSKRYIRFCIYVGLVIFFLGCSQNSTQHKQTDLDTNWGRSFETAKYRQMLNPDASKNLAPVFDLDGQAVEANIQKYRDTFSEERREAPVNILNLQ